MLSFIRFTTFHLLWIFFSRRYQNNRPLLSNKRDKEFCLPSSNCCVCFRSIACDVYRIFSARLLLFLLLLLLFRMVRVGPLLEARHTYTTWCWLHWRHTSTSAYGTVKYYYSQHRIDLNSIYWRMCLHKHINQARFFNGSWGKPIFWIKLRLPFSI